MPHCRASAFRTENSRQRGVGNRNYQCPQLESLENCCGVHAPAWVTGMMLICLFTKRLLSGQYKITRSGSDIKCLFAPSGSTSFVPLPETIGRNLMGRADRSSTPVIFGISTNASQVYLTRSTELLIQKGQRHLCRSAQSGPPHAPGKT